MATHRNAKRNANGQGGVYRRAGGRWEAKVFVDTPDGRRKRISVYGDTEQEALNELNKLRDQQCRGIPVATSTLTVSEYMTYWLEQIAEPSIRRTTPPMKAISDYTSFLGSESGSSSHCRPPTFGPDSTTTVQYSFQALSQRPKVTAIALETDSATSRLIIHAIESFAMLAISRLSHRSIKYYNDTANQAKHAATKRTAPGGGLAEYYSEGETRTSSWLIVGDKHAIEQTTGLNGSALDGGDADTEDAQISRASLPLFRSFM